MADKKTAVFTDEQTNAKITLIRKENDSIDFEVNNALGLMRIIAEKMNFSYDPEWNTQRLGRVLIDELNNPNRSAEKAATKQATTSTNLGANVVDLSQDPDVQWYLGLSDFEKYVFLAERDYAFRGCFDFEQSSNKLICIDDSVYKPFNLSDVTANGYLAFMECKRFLFNRDKKESSCISNKGTYGRGVISLDEATSNDMTGLLKHFNLKFYKDDEDAAFPMELKDVKGLIELEVEYLKKEMPSEISGFEDVEEVNLNYAKIKEFPMMLSSLKKLKTLKLAHTHFAVIPDDLSAFTNLEELVLARNESADVKFDLEEVWKLKTLPKLKELNLPEEFEEHKEKLEKEFPNVKLDFTDWY